MNDIPYLLEALTMDELESLAALWRNGADVSSDPRFAEILRQVTSEDDLATLIDLAIMMLLGDNRDTVQDLATMISIRHGVAVIIPHETWPIQLARVCQ